MPQDNLPPPDRSIYVQPKRSRNPIPTLLVLFLISVTLFMVRNWSNLSSNFVANQQSANSPAPVDINAGVINESAGDDYLCKVTNNDNFAWSNISFEFNEILETGRSEAAHAESIAPGETITIKASQFNPGRPLPFAEVRIGCDTPQGHATWDGNLSPEDLHR